MINKIIEMMDRISMDLSMDLSSNQRWQAGKSAGKSPIEMEVEFAGKMIRELAKKPCLISKIKQCHQNDYLKCRENMGRWRFANRFPPKKSDKPSRRDLSSQVQQRHQLSGKVRWVFLCGLL